MFEPRRFHSYGPVDLRIHYGVERRALVNQTVRQLVGDSKEPGHFFTIWAPRQTGKTWLMRRAMAEIEAQYPAQYIVGTFSMGAAALEDRDPVDTFLERVPFLFDLAFDVSIEPPSSWSAWAALFRPGQIFDRPVILLIDKFDDLPPAIIDRLVRLFREMYLMRDKYMLRGLALIGVRAVLGVDSSRGSPSNIQRSVHVPRLCRAEVETMFAAYQTEHIDAPALCRRYIAYLNRLKAAGKPPFAGDLHRSDLGLREAVGHFHLYAWLQEAVGHLCKIIPEFPTGNGKVDLLLEQADLRAVIEVKSFTSKSAIALARTQVARYAQSQKLDVATLALFIPVSDPAVLETLSTDEMVNGVRVVTVAIGWS